MASGIAAAALLVGCTDAPRAGVNGLRGVLGESGDTTGFKTADRVVEFAFPRDHGPHPRFRSEWWYLTAVLTTAGGRTFGTQFTLFRQGLVPRADGDVPVAGAAAWRTGQIYMAHVAVSDVAMRRHWQAERVARGHPALAGVTTTPFAAYLEDWRLESVAADFLPLELVAATPEFEVVLTLTGTKPIVLQGERGLSHKGPDNASYYYSIPRIDARGSVRVDGTPHAVVGKAWIDREWSTSVLAAEYAGWDWFALHLDDGRDLMVFRLRRVDGAPDRYGAGSLVAVNGDATTLADDDFTLAVVDTWRAWPVQWELTLNGEGQEPSAGEREGLAPRRQEPSAGEREGLAPRKKERFLIEAAFEDQVMDTSVRYWEGVVAVRHGDGRPAGSGYMEMTGYEK